MKFGTDGWRGIIAQDFTFDNVRVCAQAVADYLKETGLARRGLVMGYDTRFASEDFAAAAAEVVAGNGVKVYLCPKATPTPAVSFGIVSQKAGGGIIITASHNPARWNGLKFKNESGSSAAPEVTARIEENIARILATGRIDKIPLAQAQKQGLLEYLDLEPVYCRQLSNLINLEDIRRARLKIVIDPMYGAGAGYFEKLLADGAIKLIEINSVRNPAFPGIQQPEPIGTNLNGLTATVKKERASVGLATDGDADRLGVIDENGTFISTAHIFALLCLYLLEVRGERGPIVKTLTMSSMLYRLGELFNVPVYETPVGFKYVAPIMQSEQALIGGEESGGYGFRGHVLERDGILAGLYFLDLMIKTGKRPSELIDYLHSKVGPHYYERIDVKFSESERQAINKRARDYSPESIDNTRVTSSDTRDGFRFMLADTSWLLIRFSSTEPLLRLYAESNSQERVDRLLGLAQELVKA
ncbi:MAG: phosphoglucomutase/phosphomannomutase family protein [Dehalococcoidales bacterium]|nr:phosphoglucomutase/phosphomannomutase family protein [Dehalococcoidales bacterium]